jgi:hypothetical protein
MRIIVDKHQEIKLLTREEFRKQVLTRDGFRCVICVGTPDDVHHILDRKLFDNGGYYLDNGVSVCHDCHMMCEQDFIWPEQVRTLAHIENVILPVDFDPLNSYDKWGNIRLNSNPLEPWYVKGLLFEDQGVQVCLKRKLGFAMDYDKVHKYPSTNYHPFTPGRDPNDKVLDTTDTLTINVLSLVLN